MARVRGGKELRAALKRLPEDLRQEASKEVRASTIAMHRKVMALLSSAASYAPFWHGKAGMQNVTGAARRSFRYSVSDKGLTGKVGLLSAAAEQRAFYLRFFLNGTKDQPARNVFADAFEDERDVFIANQRRALDSVLARLG